MSVKLSDVEGLMVGQWDEDKIYLFMSEYIPELCPRDNLTGKSLQMGIKAIQRGKKIIEAITQQGKVSIGLNRERLAREIYFIRIGGNINPKRWDKIGGDYKKQYYELADAIISAEATLLEVKE